MYTYKLLQEFPTKHMLRIHQLRGLFIYLFLQTGQLLRLSQQELMDCSWGEGNNGCDGGEDFRAYQWIEKHGLASEEDYGMYLGIVSKFSSLVYIFELN